MPLPSRQDLASALLDDAYQEERANVEQTLRAQTFVAVVCDGWSDPNYESIVNFMITSPFMRPIFWCSIRTDDDQHTGQYMALALAKVIKEVEAIIGRGAVAAVFTDNAANMRKSWEILIDNTPSLTCNGCSAHTLNLLLKEMFGIQFMNSVLKNAVAITNLFARGRRFSTVSELSNARKPSSRRHRRELVPPVAMRWCSSTNCISSVVRNEEVLRAIFRNGSLLERYENAAVKLNHVQEILVDRTFWMKARAVLRLVEPVVKALGALEKDGCCLSMVYHYFRGLRYNGIYSTEADDVEEGVLFAIRGQIKFRWRMLKRETVLAAFLLDPSKHVEAFEDSDLSKAVDTCVDLASRVGVPSGVSTHEFRQAVLRFVRLKESWNADECLKNTGDTPLDRWLLNRKKLPVLHALATRVLSIPRSSAASERSWSVHSFIHNKRRNRLKPERVEKQVFVYLNSGDKDATSPVHYMEVVQDASDHDMSGDESESGAEIPAAALRTHVRGNRISDTATRLYLRTPTPSWQREPERTESQRFRTLTPRVQRAPQRPQSPSFQTPTPRVQRAPQSTGSPSFQTPTPRVQRASPTTAQSAARRSLRTPTPRGQQSSSGSPQQTRRVLFTRVSGDHRLTLLTSSGHPRRDELQAPLTQSSIGDQVSTRADEYQILLPQQGHERFGGNGSQHRSTTLGGSQRAENNPPSSINEGADHHDPHQAARLEPMSRKQIIRQHDLSLESLTGV